jgi:crotonobetainyl-CoA:carnitine CoA-transferase CaiB-like acyl-CoA transferase
MGALSGIRIIEMAEAVSGEACGKLLADLGAEVVKIERPGLGSPTRRLAPIVREDAGVEGSGLFAYLNTNKASVELDLSSPAGVDQLHSLIEGADVVIDDHDEAWLQRFGLGEQAREARYPTALFCAIRPFGAGAPDDWAAARSLNVFHASGWGYHTPSEPDLGKPPLMGPGRYLVEYETALDAALCIASSLYWRNRSGRGQSIEVSQLEVMVSRADTVVGRKLAGEDEPSEARTGYDMGGPAMAFACRDGFVYLMILQGAHWRALKTLMGAPAWMEAFPPDWLEFGVTPQRVAGFRAGFGEWVKTRRKDEIAEEAQRLGVALVSVNDASDVFRSPQLQARGFFQELEHPVLGRATYPTTPYKLSASPAKLDRPAPRLGEHTTQFLRPEAQPRVWPTLKPAAPGPSARRRGGPLEGVRVLSVSKVWAGPYAGKLLAFLGAEVIKVESNSNPDEMRAYGGVDPNRAPYFLSLNPEVLSVQVNMKSEEGLRQLREMIARSDIVLNNIRPGAMERLGLGYEELRAIKPDVIAVSIKMYGAEGPLAHQTGYAPCFAALGGLNYLVGYEGETPQGINIRYADSTVGAAAAFAAVAALVHRDRTGEGQFVDISAVETMSSMVADSLLEFSLTGRVPAAEGNRHADLAPHGCYPCANGEWISIAIGADADAEWQGLCMALQLEDVSGDPAFASVALRQGRRRDLDARISAATKLRNAEELASTLRAAGAPAFKSQSSLDLVASEHLWAREFFRLVSDPAKGSRPIVGAPWRMSQAQAQIVNGAPLLGEHNSYVYCDLLGLSASRLQALVEAGVAD